MKTNKTNFETFDHTADMGVKVIGKNFEQLFKNSVSALMNILIGNVAAKAKSTQTVTLESEDKELLLHKFLAEALYLFWTENKIITEIQILVLEDHKLEAKIHTCDRKEEGLEILREVKAITYHQLSIGQEDNKYYAKFVLDI